MPRNVWNDIVSWQTRRLNNSTKYLHHASMTTTSKKKKWNLLENCHMYALKMFRNSYIWNVLDDLTFYSQRTNLQDRLQNGPKLPESIDFIYSSYVWIQNNIVVWVILPSNADWDCFKTLTSREILRILNPLLEEHCAFLDVIHLFQSVGCVRNKLQFRTVQQNQKSFLWMQGWGWTVYPHLILWDLIVAVLGNTNQSLKERRDPFMNKSKTKTISRNNQWFGQCWFYSFKRQLFSSGSYVVHLWRQRSSYQDDSKGKKSFNETCFQNSQSCSWLVVRSNQFGPQNPNQIHWHQKPNSQTYKPRELSSVMNGIILCVCLTLAISVVRFFLRWCQKERKKDSGEERVTVKSKPMMNLVSRCSERTLDVLASIASESPGSSWNEQPQRTGRPVLDACSSTSSEWNVDKNWSSQEWKSDELMEVRTRRLVYEQPPGLCTHHTVKIIVDDDDMDSDNVAESDLSLLSRSFLHRVNDRVRKMLDQSSKDATQDSNTHSVIWDSDTATESDFSLKSHSFLNSVNDRLRNVLNRSPEDSMQDIDKRSTFWWMFMFSTLEASVFMGKNYSDNWHSIKNTEDLTMEQVFDISEEIDNRTIKRDLWGEYSKLEWFFMDSFIFDWWWRSRQSLARKGSRIFRFCVMPWKDEREKHNQILSGKTN